MRNILAVALLAAFAPLGIAHAATPKTASAKAAPSKPTPKAMKGHKMPAKKSMTSKMTKTSAKKAMPTHSAKTGKMTTMSAAAHKTTKK